jgi:hypothetical protein
MRLSASFSDTTARRGRSIFSSFDGFSFHETSLFAVSGSLSTARFPESLRDEMFIESSSLKPVGAHLWGTEYFAPKGAQESCFQCGSINISPLRGWEGFFELLD